jgi:hypothetical protein
LNRRIVRQVLDYSGQTIAVPDRWHPDPNLLQRHRQLAGSTVNFSR